MKAALHLMSTGILVSVLGAPLWAQDSKSAPLAKQLSDEMDARKMTAVAAKDASQADVYIAAMFLPGTLLVVSAKYPAPTLLDAKIDKKDFQDAYVDLQSASLPDSKVFIQDLNADGLRWKTFDTVDTVKGSMIFDGDWKKAKAASEQEYQKSYADMDDRYSKMLATLIAGLKKTS